MAQQIKVPDIGDVDEVEVIEICVAVGDRLGEDDPVVVIESDKASMEVPAGVSGTVAELLVSVGDTVTEGTPLARLEEEETAEAESVASQEGASSDQEGSAGDQRSADDDVSADDEASADEEASADDETSADDTSSGGKSAAAGDESAARQKAGSEAQDEAAAPEDGATRRQEIKVPDIGDAEDVVVIEVAVAEGDEVAAGDLLVVVESDKASMEIPADGAGRVLELHVREGSEVSEGSLLAVLEVSGAAGGEAPAEASDQAPEKAAADADADEGGADGDGNRRSPGGAAPAAAAAVERSAGPTPLDEAPSEPAPAIVAEGDSLADVPASPAVRRLARELGVDLRTIRGEGSGSRGRLTKDDVKEHVKARLTGAPVPAEAGAGAGIPPIPAVDFSRFGPVEEEPLSRIRAAGAVNLHRSWLNLPHVTHHEEADVTELEAFRSEIKGEAEARGTKVTPLAFIIRACCHVLKAHPRVNASLDGEVKHFILKQYYHIGFAVDTEQGLVVPVIRDADRLGIWELSERITDLADKARRQKLAMADMQGGTFSVSSLGNIGGTGFTPVINAPEVAILGVSRLTLRPQWNGSDFVPRKMLPLSLSYDHRAINGAEAGRFMMDLAAVLADVRRILL